MPFYLRNDTEQWFSHIKEQAPIETKFDLYYFCLMMGFATGRTSVPSQRSVVTEFQKNYVKAYIPAQKLITGLLIKSELKKYGVEATEKDQVYNILSEIIDPDTSTKLTETGLNKLNEYASGGYDVMSEEFPTKFYSVEEFLRAYTFLLRANVKGGMAK